MKDRRNEGRKNNEEKEVKKEGKNKLFGNCWKIYIHLSLTNEISTIIFFYFTPKSLVLLLHLSSLLTKPLLWAASQYLIK